MPPPALPIAVPSVPGLPPSVHLPDVRERARAAFLGLALGDALGATVEFMTAGEIRAAHGVHRELVGGGWLRLKPGQVTDDTEMSLAMARAIDRAGGWSAPAVADAFAAWLKGRELQRLTVHTVVEPRRFRALVEAVRSRDFCFEAEEHELGVQAMAVPLRTMDGRTVAALNVVGAPSRLDAEAMERNLLPLLLEASRELRPLL